MLPTGKGSEEGEEAKVGSESNPCAGQWKNMVDELTTAKYPLAVVNKLLDVFGTCIGSGYDIGCKFGTTIANSPLGPCARQLEYKSLIGSFHGHAHNRRCQLSFLAKYVEGLGLEDLEGCEWFFSKSNTLASSVQYASIFHHKQSIQEYAKHMDKQETYATLKKQMKDQGIMSFETFMQWLAEEKVYLEGLLREPLEETLQMEYYQKLVNLEASQKALDDAQAKWLVFTPENHNAWDYTRMFKLTKMNMSQIGYKLRKHIGKALKARLQAVRNALDKYNAAACALFPPHPKLSWDLVVEYAFLADFNILLDMRQD
ncbi:hypothetical protein C0993_008883, partial [Termitomyces sp. T159_Od127]